MFMSKIITKSEEEVYYCKDCLSLRIKSMGEEFLFCDHCGSTEVGVASLENWKQMYKDLYGRDYIETK